MRIYSLNIPDDVIKVYFADGGFEEKLKIFLTFIEKHQTIFERLIYPFSGKYFIDNIEIVTDVLPEFTASIVNYGIQNIINLEKHVKYLKQSPISLSWDTIAESSQIILDAWNTCAGWYDSRYLDQQMHQQIYSLTGLLQVKGRHTDLLGCLNLIYNEILLRAKFPKKLDPDLLSLYFPIDKNKRKMLLEMTGEFTKVINLLDSQPADSIFLSDRNKILNDIERIISGYIQKREIICSSPDFQAKVDMISKYAKQDVNILFIGEPGTGKEFFAKFISKQNAPFIIYDCPIYSNSTTKLETFFRSLNKEQPIKNPGFLKMAEGGTIFFREIDEMPRDAQAALYRTWKDGDYKNIRFIASSKKNINWLKEDDNFRHDLYLNLFKEHIELPSVKDRSEDIAEFGKHFFDQYLIKEGYTPFKITAGDFQILKEKCWLGNLDEIKNIIEKVTNHFYDSDTISTEKLYELLQIYLQIPVKQGPMQSEKLSKEESDLCRVFEKKYKFITQSKSMIPVLNDVKMYAEGEINILLFGETGVGKEILAKAIHKLSPRRDELFMERNCAAFSSELLESELFGYEKGSHGTANINKKGIFEIADKGTVFLDEIGRLSHDHQGKILKFLDDGQIQKIGSTEEIKSDVRIIFGTNQNLDEMVNGGPFLKDLFYRIDAGHPITIPPLRERKTDIPLLCEYFFTKKLNIKDPDLIIKFKKDCFIHLLDRPWSGNVRELEYYISKLVIKCTLGKEKIDNYISPQSLKKFYAKKYLVKIQGDEPTKKPFFKDNDDLLIFKAGIKCGMKWSELIEENTKFKTIETCKKTVYTIIIRLQHHFRSIDEVVEYLTDEEILTGDSKNDFRKKYANILNDIKEKKENKNFIKRYIHKYERDNLLPKIDFTS